MTKLTIITVCYNSIDKIEKTIENVRRLKDNYKNHFEILYIVVDGSSGDGTRELISSKSSGVDKFVSEPDEGIYDAMNKGWNLADESSYILFLGAGDGIQNLPDLDSFDGQSIVYGDVLIGRSRRFSSAASSMLKISNTIHHQAMFVPKALNVGPPFATKYKTYADFDFNQRLYRRKINFKKDEAFTSFADPDGVSKEIDTMQIARICLKNFGIPYFAASLVYTISYKLARSVLKQRNPE